jgi:hypothetical protein
VISKQNENTDSDDFKVLVLSDNCPLKIALELLKACFCLWEEYKICAACHSIIILFILNVVNYFLRWWWEHVIYRMVAAVTTDIHLGNRCAVSLIATNRDQKGVSLVNFIPAFTYPLPVLISKCGAKFWACGQPPPLDFF